MSNKEVFDQSVLASAAELFQSVGIELCPVAKFEDSTEYAATIGFSAGDVRGLVGIGMNPSTFAQLFAGTLNKPPAADPEDWLGECVNQLLGRLKNKLLPYGVVISPALPTVLRGVRLHFRPTALSSFWMYGFEMPAGLLCVWLDVCIPESVVFALRDDPEFQGTPEGALLLF